jgi:hypothetical protein
VNGLLDDMNGWMVGMVGWYGWLVWLVGMVGSYIGMVGWLVGRLLCLVWLFILVDGLMDCWMASLVDFFG